eukprot:2986612-Amphidinium_carterae.1
MFRTCRAITGGAIVLPYDLLCSMDRAWSTAGRYMTTMSQHALALAFGVIDICRLLAFVRTAVDHSPCE